MGEASDIHPSGCLSFISRNETRTFNNANCDIRMQDFNFLVAGFDQLEELGIRECPMFT